MTIMRIILGTGDNSERINAWIAKLEYCAHIELQHLLLDIAKNTADEGVLEDWIEENGGERAWHDEIMFLPDTGPALLLNRETGEARRV